ncbi:UDP-2,3-diacylglucosamine pyrophosphatase LpxG [Lachnospiraceae bacterium]|nr:UDP-2,3-diacylglucosamine pyrophosphatase LpxG [Lachnospiraceae bacterium]
MLAVYLSPIYIIANSYLLIRLHRWLGTCNPLFRKTGICVAISLAYVFLVASLLIAFFLPIGPARRIMKLISNYWLGILLYLILAVLMADAICFLLFLITKRRLKCRTAAAGGICAMVVLVLSAWGAYNARIIQVTPYEITVNKDGGRLENLNVVLAADLHLGYNIGTAPMMQMVDKINEQNADLVVFAGDIFDNEYEALDDPEELIAVLQKIQSKHGVYACYGNHDVEEKILAGFTFGGNKKKESSIQMDEFLERAGIHLLQDEAVLIDDSFYLYGRPDAQRPGRGINMRKTAAELMGELDTEKPVIVIDHEPKELQELADAGVNIDLCGHTHDGQMFPANLITALMWENSYGYLKKSEKGPYAYDCDFGCRAFWTEYACRYDCGNQPHHSTFSI